MSTTQGSSSVSNGIKVVPYENKYKEQVLDLHKRVSTQHIRVKRFQWFGLFFKRNGVIAGSIYLTGLAYLFNYFIGIFIDLNFILSTGLLVALILLQLFPYLSKRFTKQAIRYANSLAENDLEDIQSNYQSQPDKNFWVALDEYQNVCGCIGLSNTMPMETEHHLRKYIKDNDNIKIAELKPINVSENHRRRGIANLMIMEAVQFAREQHFNAIVQTAISVNAPSIALYKKNGCFLVSQFFFQVVWKIFGISVEVYLKLL